MNTAGGNLPSADGAFERFLTAAIATIITIMFSWRLLTDVSDYDSAGCLLAAPPVGLKHLAVNGTRETVDDDDEEEDDDQSEEEEEEETKHGGRRKEKKRTIYKGEGIEDSKNELPGRFHSWGHGEDLLDYETCLRIVKEHERRRAANENTPGGLNVPVSTSDNMQRRTNNNTVFITYGKPGDKPMDRVHAEQVARVGDSNNSQTSSYLQLERTGSHTFGGQGWFLSDEEETSPDETDPNINVINLSPLEVKKEVSSIRGGVSMINKINKQTTKIIPGGEISSNSFHHPNHNNGQADTNTYWTSPSVVTTTTAAMESVSPPLQQVFTPPPSSSTTTCVKGKSSTLITTATTVTTTTARKSVNVDHNTLSSPSPSTTGISEKLYESPMTTAPTISSRSSLPSSSSSSSPSSSSSSHHTLSPGRRSESGSTTTTSSQIPHHQRDSRPKQPPPPPPPRKPSTSGASNVINSNNNDQDNRLDASSNSSSNIPPKTSGTPPILGRRTLSNNNNKASFANRNNPSATTASSSTTPTTTAHPTRSYASSSTTSNIGEVTPSLSSSRVEGGCNREFRDIIDDDNFQQMIIPSPDSTTTTTTTSSQQRTMSTSSGGFGFRGRYQPRLPSSSHQHYDSDSDSESESESEVFYFYGLEPIEEEDSDDLSSDSDHSVDYEVKGAFPSSITFDEHSKVDEDQLPQKKPPPLPPRTGGTSDENIITCARIPQLPVRRKGMSTTTTTTSDTGRGVLATTNTAATTTKPRLSADSDSDNDNDDDDDDDSNDSSSNSDSSPTTSGSYSFIKGSSIISGLPTKSVITTTNYIPEPLPGQQRTNSAEPSNSDHVSLFTVSSSDRNDDADTSEESCIDSSFASTSSSSNSSVTGSITAGRTDSNNEVQQHHNNKQVAAPQIAANDTTAAGFSSVAIIDPSPVIKPPPFLLAKKTVAPCSDTSTATNATSTTTTVTSATSTTATNTTTKITSDTLVDNIINPDLPVTQSDSLQKPSVHKRPGRRDQALTKPALPPKPKLSGIITGKKSPPRTQPHKKVIISTPTPVSSSSPTPVTSARPLSMTVGDLSDTSRDLTTYNEFALLNFTSPERSTRVKDDYVKPVTRTPLLLSSSHSRERSYSDGDVHTDPSQIIQASESHQAQFIEILESIDSSTRDRLISSNDLPDDEFILSNGKVAPMPPTSPPVVQSSPFYAKGSRAIKMYCDAQRSNAAENAPRGFTFSYTEEPRTDYTERNYFMDNDRHETDSMNNNTIEEEDEDDIDDDDDDNNLLDNNHSITRERTKSNVLAKDDLEINVSHESDVNIGVTNLESTDDMITDITTVDNGSITNDIMQVDNDLHTTDIICVENEPKLIDNIDISNDSLTKIESNNNNINNNTEGHLVISDMLSSKTTDTTTTTTTMMTTDIDHDENYIANSPSDNNVLNTELLDNGPVLLKRELSLNEADTTDTISSWTPDDDLTDGSGRMCELLSSKEDFLEDLPEEEVVPDEEDLPAKGETLANVCVLESGSVMRPPPLKDVVPPGNVSILESGMVMKPPPGKVMLPNNVSVLESGIVMRPPPAKGVVIPFKDDLQKDLPKDEIVPNNKEDIREDLPVEETVPNNVCVLESGTVMRPPPPVGIVAKEEHTPLTPHAAFNDSHSSDSENRYPVAENEALDPNSSANNKPEEIVSLSVSNGANKQSSDRKSVGDVGGADTIFSRTLSNLDIDYEMFKMDCMSHSEDYASVYSLNKLGTCSSEGHLGPYSSEGRLGPYSSEGRLAPCSSEGRLRPKPFTADSSTELDNSNNNNSTGEDFDQSGPIAGGRTNLSQEEEEEIEDHLTDLSDRFSPESRIYGSGRHYTSSLQRPLQFHPDQRVEGSTNKMPISRRKINAVRNKYFSADNVSDLGTTSSDVGDPVGTKFARHHKATVRALKRRDAAKRLQLHVDTSLCQLHQGLSASKSLGHLSQGQSRSKLNSYPEPRLPRPSFHEVHPDCILSPSNADVLEESVRAASIDNLESCLSRYGSIASLVETDLDTGETVERHFSYDFDVFEIPFSFQRAYFGKSASMMDLHSGQPSQQQQVRHSTGRGRFADRHVPKSKSMQALETNLDDDDEDDLMLGESTFRRVPSVHELRVSRSLQKLNVPDWYKKSSVSRSGSCILNRDTDSMRSYDWRFTPSLTSSPASSIISQNQPIVIKTRVTPAYSRSLTTPMKAPKLTLPPKPANVSLPSDKFRSKDKPKGLMPIPIVPFAKIRDMFENKSRSTEPPSPSANSANIKTSPIKTNTKPETPKRITPIKRSDHEVTPQPKKSPISQGFSPALRIEEAIEETNEEYEEEEDGEQEQYEETQSIESGRNGVPSAHEFETIKGDISLEVTGDHIFTNGDHRSTKQQIELGSLLVKEGDHYRIVEEAPSMIRRPIARRAVPPSEEQPEPSSTKKGSPSVPPKPSSAKPVRSGDVAAEEPVEISRREELAAATPIKTVKVSDRIMQYDTSKKSEKKEKEKDKEKDWKPKLFSFRDSSKQAKSAPAKQTPPSPAPRPKLSVPFFRSRKETTV